MAKGDIRLSPKFGVNPSMGLCFWCWKENGTIVLPGKLPGDKEAPRNAVWDKTPCEECAGLMKAGIICISVEPGPPTENPFRTGGWVVVKDEAIAKLAGPEEVVQNILRQRWTFIDNEAWDRLGFPPRHQTAPAAK